MGTITRQGRPLNEEEKKEWEKAFSDMQENFEYLEKQKKETEKKETEKKVGN